MPVMRHQDAEIYYEVYGQGFPVLLFAPGGMRSRIGRWREPHGEGPLTLCDWTAALADRFCVVAMDQRNAGQSRAPITADQGWHSYAADHLALMDHLGHRRFHTIGACIGGSFCLKLCEIAPDRIASAVLQNPIGLNPDYPEFFPELFAGWAQEQRAARPDLDMAAVERFGRNLWNGEFVFSVSRDFARRCPVSTFLMPGRDRPHPAVVSGELAALLPGVEVLQAWEAPVHADEQRRRVIAFLERNTAS